MLKLTMYTKAVSYCHISSVSVMQFNQMKHFCVKVLNFLLPNKSYFLETSFSLSALNPVSLSFQADVLYLVYRCKSYIQNL